MEPTEKEMNDARFRKLSPRLRCSNNKCDNWAHNWPYKCNVCEATWNAETKEYDYPSKLGRSLPEVGEICLFHDDPLVCLSNDSANDSHDIAPFVSYNEEHNWYCTATHDFKFCTRLKDTLI